MPVLPWTPPLSRRLARAAVAGAAAALAATAGGCGARGDENADPARIAPPHSLVYLVATVRPEGEQAQAVERIGRTVFRVSNPGSSLQQLVDRTLLRNRATRNVSYADDVEPWLGRRAAVVVVPAPGARRAMAAIFAAGNTDAAEGLVDRVAREATPRWPRRVYRGVPYRFAPRDASAQGVVGNYLVAGDEAAFRAVVDAFRTGGALAGEPRYRAVAGDARGRLAFGYLDPSRAGGSPGGGLPAALLDWLAATRPGPVTLSVSAAPDRVTVDAAVPGGGLAARSAGVGPLMARLPDDAWLAFELRGVGRSLRLALRRLGPPGLAARRAIDRAARARTGLDLERDVLPALVDLAFFARGSTASTAGAAAVVATPDPAAARRLVSSLRLAVRHGEAGRDRRTAAVSIAGARGFTVTGPQLPGSLYVVAGGDRVVVARGRAAARASLRPGAGLTHTPQYRAAQASLGGAPPTMLLAFAPVAALVGTSTSPAAQRASAYLTALRALALSWNAAGARRTGRLVVTLR